MHVYIHVYTCIHIPHTYVYKYIHKYAPAGKPFPSLAQCFPALFCIHLPVSVYIYTIHV